SALVRAEVAGWDGLVGGPYEAVFCVGNSLTHAAGAAGRRAALRGMRGVLRDGGLLALTSRNWERPQEAGEEWVQRGGRRARVWRESRPGDPSILAIEIA